MERAQFSTSSSLQSLSKSRTASIATRNQTRTFDFNIRSQWEGLDADAGAHLEMMSTVHLNCTRTLHTARRAMEV